MHRSRKMICASVVSAKVMWTKMLAVLNVVDDWVFGFESVPLTLAELEVWLIFTAKMTQAPIVPLNSRICTIKRRTVESRIPPSFFRLKYNRRVVHDRTWPECEAFCKDEETVLAESDDSRGAASDGGRSAWWSEGGGGVPPRSAGCRGGKGATFSSLGLSTSTCKPSRNPISPRFWGNGPAWGRTSVASDEDEAIAFDAIERKRMDTVDAPGTQVRRPRPNERY